MRDRLARSADADRRRPRRARGAVPIQSRPWQGYGKRRLPVSFDKKFESTGRNPLITTDWCGRAATVFAAATAGVLLTAGAAHASDAGVSVLDDSGYAIWTEDGDNLQVCDRAADGWGVRGYIYVPTTEGSANGTVLIKASDPKYDTDCASVSVNLDEHIDLSIKVCNYKGASIVLCNWLSIPGRPSQET